MTPELLTRPALLQRPAGLDALLGAAAPDRTGRVTSVAGLRIGVRGLPAALGDLLLVGDERARTEVVAVEGDVLAVMPIDRIDGIRSGAPVRATGARMT